MPSLLLWYLDNIVSGQDTHSIDKKLGKRSMLRPYHCLYYVFYCLEATSMIGWAFEDSVIVLIGSKVL